MQRHFTRAQIEQEFMKRFGQIEHPSWQVLDVSLLPELTPPTWRIRYACTYYAGTRNEYTHYDHLLFVEKEAELPARYLNGPTQIALPAGCASVQEEDAELARRDAAERQVWRKRQEDAQS